MGGGSGVEGGGGRGRTYLLLALAIQPLTTNLFETEHGFYTDQGHLQPLGPFVAFFSYIAFCFAYLNPFLLRLLWQGGGGVNHQKMGALATGEKGFNHQKSGAFARGVSTTRKC